MEKPPIEQLKAQQAREEVERLNGQTMGEILGVKNLWRKVGTVALGVGLVYGGDKYINYKVNQVTDQITEQIDDQVTRTGEQLGNQIADQIEAQLKEDVLNYLLEGK